MLLTLHCQLANDNLTDGCNNIALPFYYFLLAGNIAANHLNKHEKSKTSGSMFLALSGHWGWFASNCSTNHHVT